MLFLGFPTVVGDLYGEIMRSTVVLALANLVWYWLTWLFLCVSPRHFRLGNKYAKIRVFSVGIHDFEFLIITVRTPRHYIINSQEGAPRGQICYVIEN